MEPSTITIISKANTVLLNFSKSIKVNGQIANKPRHSLFLN
jgi:hypothetical protein